jgi:hypothetical protein
MFDMKKNQGEEVVIPKQYEGVPSEIVEELLRGEAVLANPVDEGLAKERRAKILELVRENEKNSFDVDPNAFSVLQKFFPTMSLLPEEKKVLEGVLKQFEFFEKNNQSGFRDQMFTVKFQSEEEKKVFVEIITGLLAESKQEKEDAGLRGDKTKDPEGRSFMSAQNVDNFGVKQSVEKEVVFKDQIKGFLQMISKDEDLKRLILKYRNVKFPGEAEEESFKRQSLSDLEILSKMSANMYNFIHKSGMDQKDVVDEVNVENKDDFVKNFEEEITNNLVGAVAQYSQVKHVTKEELTKRGHPGQAAGFT